MVMAVAVAVVMAVAADWNCSTSRSSSKSQPLPPLSPYLSPSPSSMIRSGTLANLSGATKADLTTLQRMYPRPMDRPRHWGRWRSPSNILARSTSKYRGWREPQLLSSSRGRLRHIRQLPRDERLPTTLIASSQAARTVAEDVRLDHLGNGGSIGVRRVVDWNAARGHRANGHVVLDAPWLSCCGT